MNKELKKEFDERFPQPMKVKKSHVWDFIETNIEKEKKDLWCDIALWVAHKKPEWYMEFTKYGAKLLNLEVCDDCSNKLEGLH